MIFVRKALSLYFLRALNKRLLFIGCFAIMVFCRAEAAELGKIKMKSGVGEPFLAEIEVQAKTIEREGLVARMATMDSYQNAGLVYNRAIADMNVNLSRTADGRLLITVSSVDSVVDPVVDLLIELRGSIGRVVESYTVFLDPPEVLNAKLRQDNYGPGESTDPEENGRLDLADGESDSGDSTEPLNKETDGDKAGNDFLLDRADIGSNRLQYIESDSVGTSNVQPKEVQKYGPVQKGDTLSKIAMKTKPSYISLEEMLVILFDKNPEAFEDGNMNRLKVGPIIELPIEEELIEGQNSKATAREIVRKQWAVYKQSVLAVARSERDLGEGQNQEAEGTINQADRQKTVSDLDDKEVLKLSQGDVGDKSYADPQQRIQIMEEELVAKDRAISEANQRLARLEKTIKDLQGLLAVRNKDLSEFQDRAAISDSSNSETIALESDNGAEIEVIADAEESVDAEEVPALVQRFFESVLSIGFVRNFVSHPFFEDLMEFSLVQRLLKMPYYVHLFILMLPVLIILGLLFGIFRSFFGNREEEKHQDKGESHSVDLNADETIKEIDERNGNDNNEIEPKLAEETDAPDTLGENETESSSNSSLKTPTLDLSDINLDLNEGTEINSDTAESDTQIKWHDVQTKFDLAKAYQEMGDGEGAREILLEVIAEGNEEQIQSAKAYLETLEADKDS